MKLGYYMRGLGTGIVVTALIMGIATGNARPLTDAEIKAAAEKLGMVDSNAIKLSDLKDPAENKEPTKEADGQGLSGESVSSSPEDGGENEGTAPENGGNDGASAPEDGGNNGISAPEDGEGNEGTAPESGENGETSAPEDGGENGNISSSGEMPEETVTITIRSGSGSREVCNQLKEAGLIEDAREFDQYLIDQGYSKRISAGTHEIRIGADWEEITKIITKTR